MIKLKHKVLVLLFPFAVFAQLVQGGEQVRTQFDWSLVCEPEPHALN